MNEDIAKQCLEEISIKQIHIVGSNSYQTYPKVFDILHLFAKVSQENNMFAQLQSYNFIIHQLILKIKSLLRANLKNLSVIFSSY